MSNFIHVLAQNLSDILTLSTVFFAVTTWIATHFRTQNKYLANVLQACLIAEKTIDATAYNSDGSFNQARMDMAISVLQVIDPKINTATVSADIEQVLSGIHNAVQTAKTTPMTNPPVPASAVEATAQDLK